MVFALRPPPALAPPILTRLEFMKLELPPEKLLAESAMLILNVLVLFRSVKPYWPGEGAVETDEALYRAAKVDELPVKSN
mmetsp:Transcript_7579/g.10753  ORF Transcript_7579/g.10753 Transcript_7579/m.10753 type:complete len:80 (-) Transcript_7579:1043-1282(-)